jgi:hypothetical protein
MIKASAEWPWASATLDLQALYTHIGAAWATRYPSKDSLLPAFVTIWIVEEL